MSGSQWRRGRGPWLVALILFALAYFGSYWRYGINFKDEGGTVTLLAKRLLAGERPFIDLELGYNVLWFYPIVGLFKIGGVSFVLLRAYCFFLSTITAVIGFLVICRAGRRPWLGFLVALLLILVPGMTFKNYMPLLAVTNSACLFSFALAVPDRRMRWLLVGGVVLGLTYLIRIDLGIFATLLWLGAICLRELEPGSWHTFSPRLRALALPRAAGQAALLAVIVVALHVPVYLDARHRGFDGPFVQQYANWPLGIVAQLRQRLAPTAHPPASAIAAPAPASPDAPAATPNQETLHRKTFSDWKNAKTEDERLLILLLYAPVLAIGLLAIWGTAQLGLSWWLRQPEHYQAALAALLLLGGALSDFPQYFFFRPDGPHLSEFSPGFWVASVGSLLLLARGRRIVLALFALYLTAHACIYLRCMLPNRWAGTIWVRKGRTVMFNGENGVHVYLSHREADDLQKIREIVRDHTNTDDYLVAYPYHPSLNVLTDRRTYERNVYVDNATAGPHWNEHAIERLERRQPAVVILSEWEINGTEESKFSHWAAPTKAWIEQHYDDQGNYLDFEVYTKRAPAPTDARTLPSPPSSTP